MQFSVTFRQMEPSDALKEYAGEKIGRIRKYLPDPIACHVVLSKERHHHRADVNLQLHNGFTVAAHESSDNMYSSIDLVISKIERQVKRYKDKLRKRRVKSTYPPLAASHSIISEEHDRVQAEIAAEREPAPAGAGAEAVPAAPVEAESGAATVGSEGGAAADGRPAADGRRDGHPAVDGRADGGPSIVDKAERFHSTPMSTNEAIMQLNLLHEQFLVYRSDQTGQVNVVYRRDDGTYGLIETSPSP